jgi:hypothetical protein
LRNNLPDDHIKSSVEVVNNIPDNQREFAGERVCLDDMKFAYSPISIKLLPDAIDISLDIATQNSIKLSDVLVSPFDLQLRRFEVPVHIVGAILGTEY